MELKKVILAKGMIDEQTVEQLRDIIFADNGIDQGKANLLFELKDTFLDKSNH